MKKNEYKIPEMQVVEMEAQQHLMAGSTPGASVAGLSDVTEEDFTGGSIKW